VRRARQKHADLPHPVRLLRAHRERPCGSRATEQHDELASLHVEHRRASNRLADGRDRDRETAIAIALAAVMVVTGWSIVPGLGGVICYSAPNICSSQPELRGRKETAALRDCSPAFVRYGSFAAEAMGALRPWMSASRQKQTLGDSADRPELT